MITTIKKPARLYNKRCPECGKGNLESSACCWSCGHEFGEKIAWKGPEAEERKSFWSSAAVQVVFVIGIIVLILIILDMVR